PARRSRTKTRPRCADGHAATAPGPALARATTAAWRRRPERPGGRIAEIGRPRSRTEPATLNARHLGSTKPQSAVRLRPSGPGSDRGARVRLGSRPLKAPGPSARRLDTSV